MRARSVKPGLFTNEQLADLPPLARLLFIGLWCLADKAGLLEDRPRRIKALVLPFDDVDVDELLKLLAASGFIRRYEVAGQRCIALPTFIRHQSPHPNEKLSGLPPPPEVSSNYLTSPEITCPSSSSLPSGGLPSGGLPSGGLPSGGLPSEPAPPAPAADAAVPPPDDREEVSSIPKRPQARDWCPRRSDSDFLRRVEDPLRREIPLQGDQGRRGGQGHAGPR